MNKNMPRLKGNTWCYVCGFSLEKHTNADFHGLINLSENTLYAQCIHIVYTLWSMNLFSDKFVGQWNLAFMHFSEEKPQTWPHVMPFSLGMFLFIFPWRNSKCNTMYCLFITQSMYLTLTIPTMLTLNPYTFQFCHWISDFTFLQEKIHHLPITHHRDLVWASYYYLWHSFESADVIKPTWAPDMSVVRKSKWRF